MDKQNRSHCINGHEYTLRNTYWIGGYKQRCRICHANYMRKRYREKKGKSE